MKACYTPDNSLILDGDTYKMVFERDYDKAPTTPPVENVSVFADGKPFFKHGMREIAHHLYTENFQREDAHHTIPTALCMVMNSRGVDFGDLYEPTKT